MAVLQCASVEITASPQYISNVSEVADSDWTWIRDIWPTFYPNIRLELLSELHAAPGYVDPPWIGWTKGDDGWTPPPPPDSHD